MRPERAERARAKDLAAPRAKGTLRDTRMTRSFGAHVIVAHAARLPFPPRRVDSMGMSLAVRRFTVDEYHRMGEAGVLHEDDRVELLDGQIVQMSPIGVRHAACVNRLTALSVGQAGNQATVSIQNPVILGDYEEPQPDVVVLRYRADGYQTGHPRPSDTLLVVEVADTTVASDRLIKIPLYARAGIPEAWLVNLPGDEIEIYQQPTGGRYARVRTARRGETLTPLECSAIALPTDDILG